MTSPDTVSSTLAQDTSDVQASVASLSKSRVAILRQTLDQDKKKRFVEIWAGDRLEASREVSSTHGVFFTEGKFLLTILMPCLQLNVQMLYHLSHSRHPRKHFCTLQSQTILPQVMPTRTLICMNDFAIRHNLGKVLPTRNDLPYISFGGGSPPKANLLPTSLN